MRRRFASNLFTLGSCLVAAGAEEPQDATGAPKDKAGGKRGRACDDAARLKTKRLRARTGGPRST